MHAVYNMLIPQRGRGFTKTWIRPDCKWSLISASDKKRGPNTRGYARVFFRLLAVQGSTNRNTKGSHALRDVAGVTFLPTQVATKITQCNGHHVA